MVLINSNEMHREPTSLVAVEVDRQLDQFFLLWKKGLYTLVQIQ